jgi:hypothetical protein
MLATVRKRLQDSRAWLGTAGKRLRDWRAWLATAGKRLQGWRAWLATNDPISLLTRLLIPHRVLVGWATVGLFVVMLFVEATRANVIATLWGVAGAGLLVSVVLAEHGEHIQRRVWVRDNTRLVNDFLAIVIDCVGEVGLVGAGVGEDLKQRLFYGNTRTQRHQAAEAAGQTIEHFADAQPVPLAQLAVHYEELNEKTQRLMHFMDARLPMLSRLTEVFGALYEWRGMALALLSSLPTNQWGGQAPGDILRSSGAQRTADDPLTRERRRYDIADLADATVDVCERCADILLDAGMIQA